MSRKLILFSAIIISTILGTVLIGNTRASANGAAITQPSDGGKLIVSSVGSYNSPISVSFLYVPSSVATASVKLADVENEINAANGRIKYFSVRPVLDPSNNCGASAAAFATAPSYAFGDGKTGVNPSQSLSFNNTTASTQTSTVGSTTYKRYCVYVQTDNTVSVSCLTAPGCYSFNVTFRLTTSGSQLLGNYSGPSQTTGTGYYQLPAVNRYQKVIDFSLPCGAANGGTTYLYDLDTYQGDSSGGDNRSQYFEIQVADKGASNWASIALVSDWPDTRSAGTNRYHAFDVKTGETVGIRPVGNFQQDKKYRLIIAEIARGNKIRINLPSDQISNEVPCITNTAPKGTVSVSCSINSGTANATFKVSYDLDDKEKDSLTLKFKDPNGTAVELKNLGNAPGSADYTVARRAANYDISGVSVSDGTAAAVAITPTPAAGANCPLPAKPVLTIISSDCTTISYAFTDPSGEGFKYTALLTGPDNSRPAGNTVSKTKLSAGNHEFTEVAQWRDFNQNNFTIKVTNESITSLTDSKNITTIPRCLTMSCSGIVVPSGAIEVNRPFQLTPQFTATNSLGTRGQTVTYSIDITYSAGVFAGPTNPKPTNVSFSAANISHVVGDYTPPASPVATVITAALTGSNANMNSSCSQAINVSKLPYVQLFRGDIIAGYGMKDAGGTCSPLPSRVRSATGTALSGGEVVGSGTQMTVFAKGAVQGFRSAITQSGQNAIPWVQIFANSLTSDDATYPRGATGPLDSINSFGGNFDTSLCAENWFDDMPDDSEAVNSAAVDISGVRDAYNIYENGSSPVVITASAALEGTRKVFVVGDVVIGGSMSYKNNWASVNDIPSSIIVATGNIYIDENVTNMDGILVSRGTIFTCSNSSYSTALTNTTKVPNELAGVGTNCYSKSLTLNGALIAQNVRLWRTGGTMSRALNDLGVEVNSTGAQVYQSGLTQAETFRLAPEVFIGPRYGEEPTNGSPGNKQLDSLISLPPPF